MPETPATQRGEGQVAFLDHVMVVTDAETAAAAADSPVLNDLGRLVVGTVESDGRTWTGRYLFGRRTYVELFGPDDLDDADRSAAGLGLSTRTPGALTTLVDRAADDGIRLASGQRSIDKDGQTSPWFDYAQPDDAGLDRAGPTFEIWVMEFLTDPNDLRLRESKYLEWTSRTDPGHPEEPVVSEVVAVEIDVSPERADDAASVLRAAGFTVTASTGLVLARDADSTISLRIAGGDEGVRRIRFALTGTARERTTHRIGRSTLTIGPGASAEWVFASSAGYG